MNSRIKQLREYLKKSRAEFGEEIGVSGDVINNMERGRVEIKGDRIKLICSVFGVREEWLRTGAGEMFEKTENDLSSYINSLPKEDGEFARAMLVAYMGLDDISRKALRQLRDNMIASRNGNLNKSETDVLKKHLSKTKEERLEEYAQEIDAEESSEGKSEVS